MGAQLKDWRQEWGARRAGLPAQTDAFRWVDEAELTLDVFADVAVLSLYRHFTAAEETALAERALASAPLRAVYLKRRPREAHQVASRQPAEVAPLAPICGAAVEAIVAAEAGAKFEIRPGNGLSVGLYLDARDARAWVRSHARGLRVLNLFSYTCGFAVAALQGGATRAVNVDLSRKVLDWGARNLALNALAVEPRDFLAGDSFEWLARLAKKGEWFGLVVVDPPSFSNTGKRRFRAERDYAELIALASRVLEPGGSLLACCNLEAMTGARFEQQVKQGLDRTPSALEAFGASSIDFAQPSALKVLAVSTASAETPRR